MGAAPATVYRILSDYRHEHPLILPKPFFKSCEVQAGGIGAGTVIRVVTEAMGVEQQLLMTVSEPEPGRVLVEEDPAAGVRTSFTVTPLDQGRQCQVTIATEWSPKPGLAGLGERLLNPLVARSVFRKQLALLAQRAAAVR